MDEGGQTALFALNCTWGEPKAELDRHVARALEVLVRAGLDPKDPRVMARFARAELMGTVRWLAEELGVLVPPADSVGWLGTSAEEELRAIRTRQQARFAQVEAMLQCTVDDGASAADAAAARAGGLWALPGRVDRHGRSLGRAARELHPSALKWVGGWETRMALALAMATHPRLGAEAEASHLSEDLVLRIWQMLPALVSPQDRAYEDLSRRSYKVR